MHRVTTNQINNAVRQLELEGEPEQAHSLRAAWNDACSMQESYQNWIDWMTEQQRKVSKNAR